MSDKNELDISDTYLALKIEVENPLQKICQKIISTIFPNNEDSSINFNEYFDLNDGLTFKLPLKYQYRETYFFVQLNFNYLKFGFFIEEDFGSLSDHKYETCKKILSYFYSNINFKHKFRIVEYNCNLSKNYSFYKKFISDFGSFDNWYRLGDFSEKTQKTFLLNDYFKFKCEIKLTPKQVLQKSAIDLNTTIINAFYYLYPITHLRFYDNPELEIKEHFEVYNPKYKLEKYVDTTYIEESQLKTWIKSITRKKQAIFYGSPGTGKTFIAENVAQYLIGGGDGFYELIQFHPAYSYEDFIQGIRPQTKDGGQLSYNLVPGRFLQFCNQAAECKDKCVLIIDEINRANLAEVFGELMYLLEYREQEICLAGSQEKFKIPDNVYLIGTMNTADRSIALVDFALRRRFAFIKIAPNYDIITKFHQQHTKLEVTELIAVLKEINNLIEDENYYLGVSFFLIETLVEDLESIWQMEIEPYLEEYFYDRLDEITDYQWENIKDRIAIYKDIAEE